MIRPKTYYLFIILKLNKILITKKPLNETLLASPFIYGLSAFPPVSFIVMIFVTILLPQFRQRIIRNQDKKTALKALSKRIKLIHKVSPIEFLRISNREISTFIYRYKIDYRDQNLRKNLNKLNAFLYGNSTSNPDIGKPLVEGILESLKKAGTI